MIWLTWRQSRAQVVTLAAGLALLGVILALTGSSLADDYSAGIRSCTGQSGGGCSDVLQRYFQDHHGAFVGVTSLMLGLPALIGAFVGAPLIARELEAGTHRLIWSQSITRTRWLAVKLGLLGLAVSTGAGLASLAVTWFASPLDKGAAGQFPRMAPLVFDARGIVPIGYAAFAFALGVAVGMLLRRTIPAMAVTLVVFAAVQIAVPQLLRPHLLSPVRAAVEVSPSNIDGIHVPRSGGAARVTLHDPSTDTGTGRLAGAWVLSSRTVDPSGHAISTIPLPRNRGCAPPQRPPRPPPANARPGGGLEACFAEINRLGYRQQVTYQPASRFWAFQWYETGIYAALALGLAGSCFWRLRRNPA